MTAELSTKVPAGDDQVCPMENKALNLPFLGIILHFRNRRLKIIDYFFGHNIQVY